MQFEFVGTNPAFCSFVDLGTRGHGQTEVPRATLAPGTLAGPHTGWGAEHGESEKRASWDAAIERRDGLSAGGVEFVPFSIEAGGVWGPAARKFFQKCVALANDDRDVDLYHWSSTRFSRAWFDSLSVLVARGRAKVSAAAAASDWPKRIRDMQYMDVDGSD